MPDLGKTKFRNQYVVECYGPTGNLKWQEKTHNIVVNAGLDHSLNVITITSHVTGWNVGLTATAASFDPGDTMGSHTGWAEVTSYSTPTTRAELTPGSISSQSVDNSASPAAFGFATLAAATTIGGVFLSSGATRGGTNGILYGGATISPRTVEPSDTVNVTITFGAEVT